jgi:hypothetical protein
LVFLKLFWRNASSHFLINEKFLLSLYLMIILCSISCSLLISWLTFTWHFIRINLHTLMLLLNLIKVSLYQLFNKFTMRYYYSHLLTFWIRCATSCWINHSILATIWIIPLTSRWNLQSFISSWGSQTSLRKCST